MCLRRSGRKSWVEASSMQARWRFATYCRDAQADGSHELEDGYCACRHVVFNCYAGVQMLQVSGVLVSSGVRDRGRRSLSAWLIVKMAR